MKKRIYSLIFVLLVFGFLDVPSVFAGKRYFDKEDLSKIIELREKKLSWSEIAQKLDNKYTPDMINMVWKNRLKYFGSLKPSNKKSTKNNVTNQNHVVVAQLDGENSTKKENKNLGSNHKKRKNTSTALPRCKITEDDIKMFKLAEEYKHAGRKVDWSAVGIELGNKLTSLQYASRYGYIKSQINKMVNLNVQDYNNKLANDLEEFIKSIYTLMISGALDIGL